MPRKGENIYKRKDGRWEGRYIKARGEDGKAIYGSVYGPRYLDVKARLIPLKAAYATLRKYPKINYKGNVRDWLAYWLDTIQKPFIKASTYASYRDKLERHVVPLLGEKRLEKLSERDIQDWITFLCKKGLAGSSIRTIYRIFNAALQKAAYDHYLFINPCQKAKLPGSEQSEIGALTLAQQKEVERQALKDKGGEAIIIALYTGMRIGEISALTWRDVDFENKSISVRKTLQRITDYEAGHKKTRVIIDIPKTYNSCRIIPFADNLKDFLLEQRASSTSQYVISCKGHYAEPRVISYRFKQIMVKAGLENMSFHTLRHTYATRCIECGIDIVTVSRLLGHTSSKMTLDIYADSTFDQRKRAMAVLDVLLSQSEARPQSFGIDKMDNQKLATLLRQLCDVEAPQFS